MKITKIKRKLAEIGIGDPLNQLLYTSDEIEKMKKEGKFVEPKSLSSEEQVKKLAREKREKRSKEYKRGYNSGYKAGIREKRDKKEL